MAVTEVVLSEARIAFDNIENNKYNKKERVLIIVYITFYASYMGQFWFEIVPILVSFYLGFALIKSGRLNETQYADIKDYILGWVNSEHWYYDKSKGDREPVGMLRNRRKLLAELNGEISEIANGVFASLDKSREYERERGLSGAHLRMWLKHRMLLECDPFCFNEYMFVDCTDEARLKNPVWVWYMDQFNESVESSLGEYEEEFPVLKETLKTIVNALARLGI
jgi:hypothetical protein